MSKKIIDTLNEVWKEAYPDATDADYDDDFRCCARIKSLADDRKCWLSNSRVLQKELNKLQPCLEVGTSKK
jgi:hypothetical protein